MNYENLANEVINGKKITQEEAITLINCPDEEVFLFAAAAHKIKNHFLGKKVKLCSIINAKSGSCSENCSFCAQSAHNKTDVKKYEMVSKDSIVGAASEAVSNGTTCFSIVTSGKGVVSEKDMNIVEESLNKISSELLPNACASLGIMSTDQLKKLKKSGLKRFHHNLETAESFFSNMCTTHSYSDRVETVKKAKEAGLEVCCGGIFGIGENPEQRVELALALRELDVESIPLNILNPIEGTKTADSGSLKPLDALRLIAMFRFIHPDKEIGVIGGRESQMRDVQSFVLVSGASTILAGNYLTTSGRSSELDVQMVKDLGLEIEKVSCKH